MEGKRRTGVLLHEEIFVRSWIDTGYLSKLRRFENVVVFVPTYASGVQTLLRERNEEFRVVMLPESSILHALGRLQWASSMSSNSSLREQRRRVLFGFRAWPARESMSSKMPIALSMLAELLKFAKASPLGALLAAFPPPRVLRKLFVWLSARPVFMKDASNELRAVDTLILPTSGFESWMNSMLSWLRRMRVHTILVPDNWDNLTSKNTLGVLPDAIVTMGRSTAIGLSTHLGLPSEILWPIGIPKFSNISPNLVETRRDVPKLLFLGFSLPYDEISTLNSLHNKLKAKYGQNFELHYKPHPNRKTRVINEPAVDEDIMIIGSQSRYVLPELDSDYNDFLHSYDLVISPPTTMLVEFLLAGTSVVLRDSTLDGFHRTTPAIFSKTWLHVSDLDFLALPEADGPDELFSLICGYLNGEKEWKNPGRIDDIVVQDTSEYARSLSIRMQNLLIS